MSNNTSPLFVYSVRELRVTHSMDLDTDTVYVTLKGFDGPIFSFDSSMVMSDREGNRMGTFSLVKNQPPAKKIMSWQFTSTDGKVVVNEWRDFDRDFDSNTKSERDVVEYYLNANYQEFLDLVKHGA